MGWSVPWSAPGGDISSTAPYGIVRVRPDSDEGSVIALNVSDAVRNIVNNGAPNYGFVLMPTRRPTGGELLRLGIPSVLATTLSSVDGVKLVLLCGDA